MEFDEQTKNVVIAWAGKIVPASLKELGLFLADPIRHWRLQNQLNWLFKTKEKCTRNNIPLKVVAPKLVYSLLELSSLEDDEYMQDKWANLFANMLDSEQNVENQIFPFILSQLSKNEFAEFDKHCETVVLAIKGWEIKIEDLREHLLSFKTAQKEEKVKEKKRGYEKEIDKLYEILDEYHNIISELSELRSEALKEFELANLSRLGLVTSIQQNTAVQSGEFTFVRDRGFKYQLSELGIMFYDACKEKSCK